MATGSKTTYTKVVMGVLGIQLDHGESILVAGAGVAGIQEPTHVGNSEDLISIIKLKIYG
jgi:hypothetical protein